MKILLTILLAFHATFANADANRCATESAIYKIDIPYANGTQMGLGAGVMIASDKILPCRENLSRLAARRAEKNGQQFVVTKHYNLGDFDTCILVGNFAGTPIQFAADSQEGENEGALS